MPKANDPFARSQAQACYDEIGRSVAALVVDGGYEAGKVWALIRDIGAYERWMLDLWIEFYNQEKKAQKRPRGRPKGSRNKRKNKELPSVVKFFNQQK